jgi:sulfotransferase
MTSPVGSLCRAVLGSSGPGNEFAVFLDEERKRRILHSIFAAYYEDTGRPVVFDTNRMWSAELPLLTKLFPEAKLIACVRNPAWIMDSLERLVRRNAFEQSRIFRPGEQATVYSRAEAMFQRDRLIGYAWSALKQAYYGDEADRLLLLDYDVLCQRPAEAMGLVYTFLGLPPFEHDFDAVEYEAEAYDQSMATPGLHTVRQKVTWEPRRTILPPDVFARFADMVFWNDVKGTKAFRIVARPAADAAGR